MNNRKTNHSRNLLALSGILVGMLASQGAVAGMPIDPRETKNLDINKKLPDTKVVAPVTKTIDNLDLTSLDTCRKGLTDETKTKYGLTTYEQMTNFCNDQIKGAKGQVTDSTDPCSKSDTIDNYSAENGRTIKSCDGTQNTILGAVVANKASEKIGSMVTSYAGAKAATDAQMTSTDVAHNYEITAKLERDTAGVEQGMAAVNTAASLLQLNRVRIHQFHNQKSLKADYNDARSEIENCGHNPPLNSPDHCTPERMQKDKYIVDNYQGAIKEQKKWAGKAALGAAESTLAATGQMLQADQLTSAADRNEEYAKELRAAGNPAGGFTTTDTTVAPTAEAPRSGGILGDGTTPVNSLATDSAIKGGGPNLGTPVNDAAPNNSVGSGPVAGTFGAGGTPNAAAGGASSGSGSGSTSADTAGNAADPAAKLADTGKVGGSYDGGSGSGAKSGGGGVGKADNGPDLSGMLAQFLPKKEEETTGKNGILEYGSRGPASMQSESLLDKNANIFQRIHETYQEKNHKGVVGI